MLRKTCLAVAAALSLAACGGGTPGSHVPRSYTLRSDLCEVLDYQAFSRWFGTMKRARVSLGTAKVTCEQRGIGPIGDNLTILVEAYKYESPVEAKKIFDRLVGGAKSDTEGRLKAEVDDVRHSGGVVVVLDSDLFLKVFLSLEGSDKSSFVGEQPRLAIEFTDQVLERLREKS